MAITPNTRDAITAAKQLFDRATDTDVKLSSARDQSRAAYDYEDECLEECLEATQAALHATMNCLVNLCDEVGI